MIASMLFILAAYIFALLLAKIPKELLLLMLLVLLILLLNEG
jgi:hypothetical protein